MPRGTAVRLKRECHWAHSATPRKGLRGCTCYLYLEVTTMEVGCGARVREIRGHRYFYFWHYEREGGRSVRREDYMGRVEDERARQDILRRMAAYHGRAEQEFARRRARIERVVARAGGTSTLREQTPPPGGRLPAS